jgi:hypothetical protein
MITSGLSLGTRWSEFNGKPIRRTTVESFLFRPGVTTITKTEWQGYGDRRVDYCICDTVHEVTATTDGTILFLKLLGGLDHFIPKKFRQKIMA